MTARAVSAGSCCGSSTISASTAAQGRAAAAAAGGDPAPAGGRAGGVPAALLGELPGAPARRRVAGAQDRARRRGDRGGGRRPCARRCRATSAPATKTAGRGWWRCRAPPKAAPAKATCRTTGRRPRTPSLPSEDEEHAGTGDRRAQSGDRPPAAGNPPLPAICDVRERRPAAARHRQADGTAGDRHLPVAAAGRAAAAPGPFRKFRGEKSAHVRLSPDGENAPVPGAQDDRNKMSLERIIARLVGPAEPGEGGAARFRRRRAAPCRSACAPSWMATAGEGAGGTPGSRSGRRRAEARRLSRRQHDREPSATPSRRSSPRSPARRDDLIAAAAWIDEIAARQDNAAGRRDRAGDRARDAAASSAPAAARRRLRRLDRMAAAAPAIWPWPPPRWRRSRSSRSASTSRFTPIRSSGR